jgi:hypothetical protein
MRYSLSHADSGLKMREHLCFHYCQFIPFYNLYCTAWERALKRRVTQKRQLFHTNCTSVRIFLFIECMVSWSALKYETVKCNKLHGLMVRGVFHDTPRSYFVLLSAWSHGLPWNLRQSYVTDSMVTWSERYLKTLNTVILSLWVHHGLMVCLEIWYIQT